MIIMIFLYHIILSYFLDLPFVPILDLWNNIVDD